MPSSSDQTATVAACRPTSSPSSSSVCCFWLPFRQVFHPIQIPFSNCLCTKFQNPVRCAFARRQTGFQPLDLSQSAAVGAREQTPQPNECARFRPPSGAATKESSRFFSLFSSKRLLKRSWRLGGGGGCARRPAACVVPPSERLLFNFRQSVSKCYKCISAAGRAFAWLTSDPRPLQQPE